MAENRYVLMEDDDGTWAVIDSFTGWPAKVNGDLKLGMEKEKANSVADVLNFLDARKRQQNASIPRDRSARSCGDPVLTRFRDRPLAGGVTS